MHIRGMEDKMAGFKDILKKTVNYKMVPLTRESRKELELTSAYINELEEENERKEELLKRIQDSVSEKNGRDENIFGQLQELKGKLDNETMEELEKVNLQLKKLGDNLKQLEELENQAREKFAADTGEKIAEVSVLLKENREKMEELEKKLRLTGEKVEQFPSRIQENGQTVLKEMSNMFLTHQKNQKKQFVSLKVWLVLLTIFMMGILAVLGGYFLYLCAYI
jgi:methyl-accepting chemotaxis protein